MSTSAVSATGSTGTASTTTTSSASDSALGKDAFLQLLVTQLKNQDPLDPMDNTAFVSQMAQFSSLEAMQNISTNLDSFVSNQSVYSAASLIGKTVTTLDSDTGQYTSGTVDGILTEGDEVKLVVGDTTVSLDAVVSVSP